jgi:hypothetical protein
MTRRKTVACNCNGWVMLAGRMLTMNWSMLGMVVWQACTHLPSINTSQVPHSPFLHLYGINASACPGRLSERRGVLHDRAGDTRAGAAGAPQKGEKRAERTT